MEPKLFRIKIGDATLAKYRTPGVKGIGRKCQRLRTSVMGAKGAGAFAETTSRLGSVVHRVVAFASCPVLTVGNVQRLERR